MKVLLTGGTGYVGSALREYVRNQGHEVRLLVRAGSEGKIDSPNSYEIIRGDVFNTNACLKACDGCDAVIHLIGIIREFASKGITFDQHHIAATSNIVDAARRTEVPRFIHMSALGARREARSNYHKTKFESEQLVRGSTLRWTIFQPSWIFGSGDHGTRQVVDLIHKPVVPLINGGKMLIQPIALQDVCTVMTKALGMPETQQETYELGGPDKVAFRELVEKVAAQFGVQVRTISVPTWVVRAAVAAFARFPSFPLTTDQLRMLLEDNVCEIDHYVRTFQIEPKSFGEILPTLLGEPARPKKLPVLL